MFILFHDELKSVIIELFKGYKLFKFKKASFY